ncbi:hypothetical protein [Haloarcula marina]|uniref:hypothetical protein n=1 Tax=Haloarcula marina TaxID=2961574 RepID=UPI0020B80EBE|nr:hypothetical protein [Halomicroarcula marina]
MVLEVRRRTATELVAGGLLASIHHPPRTVVPGVPVEPDPHEHRWSDAIYDDSSTDHRDAVPYHDTANGRYPKHEHHKAAQVDEKRDTGFALHDSGNSKYREFARRVERIKIMAMGEITKNTAEELTQYFLQGVKKQDKWNGAESIDETSVEIVSELYRRVERTV